MSDSATRSPVVPNREMSAMRRTALRQVVTDRLFLGLGALYVFLDVLYVIAGEVQVALAWAGVHVGVLLLSGAGMWWMNLRDLKHRAEYREMCHRHDLRMERLAQEADILSEDHCHRFESIRQGLGDPGPSALARQISDQWDGQIGQPLRDVRADRQARIARYEAAQLNDWRAETTR